MPRLDEKMEYGKIGGVKGFSFSGIRTEHLGATEYTLVTIAIDVTGSVDGFEQELRQCLIAAVEACQKSPRSDNLLLRVILFSGRLSGGIEELHGFKPLADIDPQKDYPALVTGGGTPLRDACYSAVGAMNAYGKKLADDDFGVNGITFTITDGDDTMSSATEEMISDEMKKAISGEILESLVSVLIGINAARYKTTLENFQRNAGITQYIDAGQATKGKLAKLAQFVSQSVSSQSQALGTGGPSQNIAPVI
ncbi:MAG: hypothetical protein WC730_04200 [Patescibacteria group bacterium]|jgi:uncharacterized protein YegL